MASIRRTATAIEVRAYAGRDKATGAVRNLYRSLPADAPEEEAEALARELQACADRLKGSGTPWTVESLISFYIDGMEADHSPTYIDSVRSSARCYVYPALGKRQADSVRPYEFARLYQDLLDHGGRDGGPLSAATVRKLHSWLKPAFASLEAMGALPANPLEGVRRPSPAPTEAQPLSEHDLAVFANYLRGRCGEVADEWSLLDAALWLDLNTGLRAGELAGLRVGDFSALRGEVAVRRSVARARGEGLFVKSTKGGKSRRVSIGAKTADAVAACVEWQRSVRRVKADSPLFPGADGRYRDPRDFSRHFRRVADALGIDKGAHLHTLRHTHATYLLETGASMRDVQERLGHASLTTTLGVYGHALPGRDAEAARRFDEVLEGLR